MAYGNCRDCLYCKAVSLDTENDYTVDDAIKEAKGTNPEQWALQLNNDFRLECRRMPPRPVIGNVMFYSHFPVIRDAYKFGCGEFEKAKK